MPEQPRGALLDGTRKLGRRRIVMAQSWATLALEPEYFLCHEVACHAAPGQSDTETVAQVLGVFRLAARHCLFGGTRMVVPTKLQEGALTGFLGGARKLCRREAEYADLLVECGMGVIYRWLDPGSDAVERAIATGADPDTFREPVLLASCDYRDGPGGDSRKWWYDWMEVDEEIAAAWGHLVTFRATDIPVTLAQFESMLQAIEELIEETGGAPI